MTKVFNIYKFGNSEFFIKRNEFDTFNKAAGTNHTSAINHLKTILGLDFSSQKILSISDTSGEEK